MDASSYNSTVLQFEMRNKTTTARSNLAFLLQLVCSRFVVRRMKQKLYTAAASDVIEFTERENAVILSRKTFVTAPFTFHCNMFHSSSNHVINPRRYPFAVLIRSIYLFDNITVL